MKRFLGNAALLSASIILVLLIAEGVSRKYLDYQAEIISDKNRDNFLTRPPNLTDIFEPDSDCGYRNRSDFLINLWGINIRTDSLGCRTGLSAPDSAAVILFIGDSMVFGLGLEDSSTIPARLQIKLSQMVLNRPCRVVNAGVIGYDFISYQRLIMRLAPKIKPDLILIGLCFNDIRQTEHPFERAALGSFRGHQVSEAMTFPFLRSAYNFMNEHSALFKIAAQAVQRITMKSTAKQHDQFDISSHLPEMEKTTDEVLAALKSLNTPYSFVYFPKLVREIPQLPYVTILEQRSEALLDLADEPEITLDCYFYHEMHFNVKGSDVVAGVIARWLVEREMWN